MIEMLLGQSGHLLLRAVVTVGMPGMLGMPGKLGMVAAGFSIFGGGSLRNVPTVSRQTSSGASAAGGCRAAPQPALSVVRVPSLPSSVCPAQPQPEAAARGCVGGGGMLGGGRQTPPQPNLRGIRACLCDIFEHFTFGSVTFICFEI